jgi:hypothetical protein
MTTRRYEVGPGAATVLARPGLALLVCEMQVPPALGAAVAAAEAAPGGWQELGRELGELLGGGAALPAFGVVAELDGGILVFLAGAVVATLTTEDGSTRRLSGVEAATWIDRVLAPDHPVVTLAPEGQPVPTGRSAHHLADGTVPAGWVRSVDPTVAVPDAPAHEADFPAPPPPPAVASEGPAMPATAEVTTGPPAGGPPPPPSVASPPTATPPTATAPAATPPASPPPLPATALAASGRATMAAPRTAAAGGPEAGTTVEGILCPTDHLNAPDATACRVCDVALDARTSERVSRPRPSLGFLVLDDGATYALDARYVLGRDPADDPVVASGDARAIALDDPHRSVSRVHAEVLLVGWDVQLLDRGSTNGTYVLRDGDWEAVSGDEPRLIRPGTRMAVGQRTFVYEAPRPV